MNSRGDARITFGSGAQSHDHLFEGGIARPLQTETLSDEQWGDYLFMRKNPKGMHHEQWRHASGCGRWFNALRDTVSYRFEAVWKIGEPAPAALIAKEPA